MERAKVFVIDEDNKRKEGLAQFLGGLGFGVKIVDSLPGLTFEPAGQDEPAIALISLNPITEESISKLRRLKNDHPQLSLIVLSRSDNAEPGVSLLRQGIINQLASPDHWGSIFSAVTNELTKQKLTGENALNIRHLRKLKLEQSQNRRNAAELEEIYNATLENLMTALDLRDVETFGHSLTVAKYCQALAQLIGIKDIATLDNIRKGALLHDIGKIAIPDSILKKPSRLSASEWEKVKLHPVLGYGLIREIKMVKEVGNIILYHHEKYDGTGYPKGLKKEAIPLEARIFALADALDAITSHRPYRKEKDFKAAKKDIQENKGTQFDPQVVDAFCSLRLEDWEKIRYETTKTLPNLENFSELFNKP
jgi:putative nucleotidyltransferase with HDIG domain